MALTVTFAGSGDAFGSGGRLQACLHLAVPGRAPVLLDCGATSLVGLKRLGLDPSAVDTVVVSHLHGDHAGGLPFLVLDGQFSRRTRSLAVVGPAGTAAWLDRAMEVAFAGSSTVRRRFEVTVAEVTPGVAYEDGGLAAVAYEVDHPSGAPALAWRVTAGGATVGYTGDTAWTGVLADVAAGADLLVAEAYQEDRAVPYHLRYADLLAHRDVLRADRVVLTHLSAPMLAAAERLGLAAGAGPFEVAHDGLRLTVGPPA